MSAFPTAEEITARLAAEDAAKVAAMQQEVDAYLEQIATRLRAANCKPMPDGYFMFTDCMPQILSNDRGRQVGRAWTYLKNRLHIAGWELKPPEMTHTDALIIRAVR
ncbi:MAG: hypothetical protein QG626_162 [Patescibacteria group bacterium]|jgi:hypothetical protein|nr:hypothetical protein [Patescibacteria group bacterium]